MGMKIKNNAVNQAEKGTVIYTAGELIDSVCIILKGRVLAVNAGSKILMGSGCFLGINDLYIGRYANSYIAFDDLTFYSFPIRHKEEIDDVFAANKDYKGLMVASLIKYISEAEKIYSSLQVNVRQLYDFMSTNYEVYLHIAKRLGYQVKPINLIQDMEPYNVQCEIDEKKLLFYKECAKTSHDVWKAFCTNSDMVALYLIEEISGLIVQISDECNEMSAYIEKMFDGLMNNSEECLFKNIASLALMIEESGGSSSELLKIIDDIVDQINIIEKLFSERIGRNLSVDRDKMEQIYYTLLSKADNSTEQGKDQVQTIQNELLQVERELNSSLKQIMQYANLDIEKAGKLEQFVIDFINLKDKHSSDDGVRILRKRISEQFYELYELVFLKAYQEKEIPRVIDLFLKYGFLDERLFTKDQLIELFYLDDQKPEESGPCHVYNIKDWLIQIYKGNKEPSKNEFDMDYRDMLRDRRKRAEITEAEEKELQNNLPDRLSYEIQNMFKYNHRLVNGQITTFIPILFGENIVQGIKKLFVTADLVNQAVNELLDIDYSVFYREVMYVNNEKGIVKEYIMQQIFPDIVLLPTVGYNGIMWQEITGKKRNSEGRFFMPAFAEIPIKEMLIKVFGRFRWELCRSIQGSVWNNIKFKSLTSEYADYVQFYRKNHDLSEEAKEKLKLQIQRGKSNYREVFVIDYEAWIKGEASGSLRLNKIAREMLATYCPFSKPIRERVIRQPLFAEAMTRYQREKLKKIRETEIRCRALEKENIEIPEEIMETVIFYRDL